MDALNQMTGQRTVPNVFINGKHIGGCDTTIALHSSGELAKLLVKGQQERDVPDPSKTYDYDVIVIGGGSGGLACAKVSGLCVCVCVWGGGGAYAAVVKISKIIACYVCFKSMYWLIHAIYSSAFFNALQTKLPHVWYHMIVV